MQQLLENSMDRPVAQDPVLETHKYHLAAAKKCWRTAKRFKSLKNRAYDSMQLNDTLEMKDLILLFYQTARDMQEYEEACARYHLSMSMHFTNIHYRGFGNPTIPVHPSRHEFGL
jgi:hypothetical protein